MTREQYERMRRAAAEILRIAATGFDVLQETVDWATWLINSKPIVPPPRPAFNQEKVLKAMNERDPPIDGRLAKWISQQSGVPTRACAVTLCYMVKTKRLAMIKIPGRSRFFLNETAMQQGRPIVEADEERRAAALRKPPRPARLPQLKPLPEKVRPKVRERAAPPPPPPAPPPPPPPAPRFPPKAASAPQVKPAADVPMIIPPHVQVQHIPSGRDTRYTVDGPVEGELTRDWKAKRGIKS